MPDPILVPDGSGGFRRIEEHVTTDMLGVPHGVAALDATGKVPTAQLPPGQTGGVTSVNGKTGEVVLALEDLGAAPAHSHPYDPAGTGAGQVAGHEAAPDPHPGYATEAQVGAHTGASAPHAGHEAAGAAAAVVAAHLAAVDHPALVVHAAASAPHAGHAAKEHTHPGGAWVEPWAGKLHVAYGDGNPGAPDVLWAFQNTVVSVANPTPTNVGASIGRLVAFRFATAITVATVRWLGLGTVSNLYTLAICRADTGERLWVLDPANVVAGWNASQAACPFTVPADVPCWLGLGAKGAGTAAGFRTPASPIANSLGVATIPGKLATLGPRYAQVALVAGAWPATLPAVSAAVFASAGASGTLPMVFLEAA